MQADQNERIISALDRIEAQLASLSGLERSVAHLEQIVSTPERPGQRPGRAGKQTAAPVRRVSSRGNDEELWLEAPEDQIASFMSPFANEQRIKLLKALYLGIAESGQLKEFTGLTGGQLYHHLKELALARFLSRQVRGEYHLSTFGYYAFSALMIIASELLTEEPDEELATPEEIEID